MNPISLKGKTIIITGGNGFLASQFIPFLKEMGAKVHVFDKKSDKPVDITDPKSVEKAVVEVIKKDKKIDGLVHAAAIDAVPGSAVDQFAPYEKFSLEMWNKEFSVNLTAAQIVTQAVAPHMMKAKSGSIVFIASDLAMIAPNNSIYDEGKFKDIAYVSSKAGMMGLMRAWASYLGKYNVRANALVPGGMRNKQSDEFAKKNGMLNMLGRMSNQGEYNAAVAFLLSDATSYMTGSPMIIDGGRIAW
jgi:NAD(P)-dependent dehydrogenase (short-subunit alcohol dehydrogenase family)